MVQRNRCGPVTNLPNLVTHDLIHNLQQLQNGMLLSAAIREDIADFVAELVNGSLGNNARLHRYGNAHEREMGRAAAHNWLANPGQEKPEKPCDLSYYVGYKICQEYYAKAPDKKQAVAAMLTTKDFTGFLRQSGYGEHWKP